MSLPKKTERTKFVIWLAKKSVCLCFPYKFVLLLSLRIKSKGSKSLFFSHQPLFTSPHLFGSPQSLLQLGPVVFMSKQHGSTLVKSHAKPNLPQIERPVIFVQDQPGWLWVGLHPLTEPVSHTSFSARVQNNFILYGSEFILWQRGFQISSSFFFTIYWSFDSHARVFQHCSYRSFLLWSRLWRCSAILWVNLYPSLDSHRCSRLSSHPFDVTVFKPQNLIYLFIFLIFNLEGLFCRQRTLTSVLSEIFSFIKTHTFSLLLSTNPMLQYCLYLLQSVISRFILCWLFSYCFPGQTRADRLQADKPERELWLFHYRFDNGYISDWLSVPVKQWHIRHATSNVVFLVLTRISCGFSSLCSESPAVLVWLFTSLHSQVLVTQECVCVVCVLPCMWVSSLQESAMAWQHLQDKGDKKMERDREWGNIYGRYGQSSTLRQRIPFESFRS